MPSHHRHGSSPRGIALACYLALVIYGSLVPLDFHARSLAEAWQAFRNLPFLHLGVEDRADWIANGVLYAPLGFLAASVFGIARRAMAGMAALLAIVVCCLLAVGV